MTGGELLDRYSAVREKVESAARAAGREPSTVRLVAVSKAHSYPEIRALYEAGHRDFGENYVQELVEKAEKARSDGLDGIRWHFIGHLQTNKVKTLLRDVRDLSALHGVDSLRLAEEIAKRSASAGRSRIPILLEVNVDSEESKSGVRIPELRSLVEAARSLPNLDVRGLMAIPDPNRALGSRDAFRRLSALAADLRLPELSMGMTSDFVDAIAEGATLVRIGTAIFGERSPREKL